MNMQSDRKPASDQSRQASEIIRAISILYNNSRVYSIEHPVFRKTLAEHMEYFQEALIDFDEIDFSFVKGKVRCGSLLLDPGSSIFQALSHIFEGMGVSGLSVCRGITADELTRFIGVLTSESHEISRSGLQKQLDIENITHIIEKTINLEQSSKAVSGVSSGAVSEENKIVKKPSVEQQPSSFKVFDLDDETMNVGGAESETASDEKSDGGENTNAFKTFVTGALTDLAGKKADVNQVADRISNEFKERLFERTTSLRMEKDMAVRKLESVKNVVFEKLEALNVMAILVDTGLKVLAMTSSARFLLGDMKLILPDSPLAECVRLKAAYMDLHLNGKSLIVQTIISDTSGGGETILLLTLNPDQP